MIENAIDRSLIAGLKPSAAEGIADGIARQLAHEFARGRSVGFGHYFYGRPYLSGTVDANGRLTAANGINVRLYKGEDFKLTLDDFSFSYEDGGNLPKVDFVLSSPGNLRGEVVTGGEVSLNGRMLHLDGDANTVVFREEGAEGAPVVVDTFTAAGPDILSFDCPAALVAGKAYEVTVLRTQEDGTVRTSNRKRVTVKAGATPPVVNPPLIESVESQNEPEDTVNLGGAYLFVYGDNLDTATEVKVYNSHDEVVATVPVTFVPAGEMTPARLESTSQVAVEYTPEGGSENGKVEVTTAGGTNAKTVTLVSH